MRNKKNIKKYLSWMVATLVFVVILAVIYCVDFAEKDISARFPEDGLEASLKMSGKGYAVTVEDNFYDLSAMAKDAADMYGIAFTGNIEMYLTLMDDESGELQAEIFYFENKIDAELLYASMNENWQFTGEEGQLRIRENVVYMGYRSALDAFEK
jgi:hypothetical protein